MRFINSLRYRIATLFQRSGINADMEDELRSHIQLRADDLERSGLSRAEAERRAGIEFGGRERYRQESHEAVGGTMIESLLQDLRFSLRVLFKSPGFAVVAVLTLALAIGANAVVFSMLNGLVLRPLDVPNGSSLFLIERASDGTPIQSYPDYLDMRDRNKSFDGLLAYQITRAGLDTGRNASSSWLYEVSGNYFDVLDVKPYAGRFFHSADEHGPNSAPYIVLSYAYWRTRFHADSSIVGRSVLLNKFPFTILGVAPSNFHGTELFYSPDFWAPIVNQEQIDGYSALPNRSSRSMGVLGPLKPGISQAQAVDDLNRIAAYLEKAYPKDDDKLTFKLAKPGLAGDMLGPAVRAFLGGLMAFAALILLGACANLGSLFTARASDRSKEIALRLALGSNRRRIVRQLLTEAVLISLIGGTVGVAGSIALLRWFTVWQPLAGFPVRIPISPDIHVYAIALLLTLASGILFGIVPVRQILRANPYEVVKTGSSRTGSRRFAVRDILLVVQVAICAILVVSSLVAVRGLIRSMHSNFGFEPQGAILADTDLDMAGYKDNAVAAMQRRAIDALSAIPGVSSVGLIDRPPLSLGWSTYDVYKDDVTDMKISNAAAEAMTYSISPDYFKAARTTLMQGRSFTWHDDKNAPLVAVVNEEFAREVFGSVESAIGRYFKIVGGTRLQVVGIVENGRYRSLTEDQQPALFRPIQQAPTSSTTLIIRSNRNPRALASTLETALRNLDPAIPFSIGTWDSMLDFALFPSRAATVSLGVLGILGSMLAVTGIFGMAAYSVSKRFKELGIRVALGAQRSEVLKAALGRSLKLLALGSAVGLILGIMATRVLAFVVYQATPRDPWVLCGAVLAMLLLGLVATWIPAHRALKINPLMLLREE